MDQSAIDGEIGFGGSGGNITLPAGSGWTKDEGN